MSEFNLTRVRGSLIAALFLLPVLVFAQVESEPNNSLTTADDITAGVPVVGTVGCSTVDREDYFGTLLTGDGTVRLMVTYTNTSGDAGADASAYVYDGDGALLVSRTRLNVPVGAVVTDTLLVYSRMADRLHFRLYSTYCFGYTLQYEMIEPPTPGDAEPNNELGEGSPLAHGTVSTGRIGYRGSGSQDQTDYWEATLPDDGTVNLSLTFYNTSNDSGADVYAYIYDKAGRLLASQTIPNVNAGGEVSATVTAYCRGKDPVYFRVYSLYSFGYEISYTVTPPPTAADAEPNNEQSTAAAYTMGAVTEGRIGYHKASGQDQNDYYKTTLSDDGNIRLIVTYLNTSNDAGADAYAYIYDGNGRLLRSRTRANVAVNGEVTDTLYAPGRAQDQIYFRIYSLYCFGYRIQADIIEPETSGDEEPNDDQTSAANLAHDTETEGRVGFSTANQRDENDYFRALLPDDGTVTVTVDYINESNDSGADAYAYIYDSAGRLLNSMTVPNVAAGSSQQISLSAYGRSRDTVYIRLYSLYSFSYRLRYKLTPPPTDPDPESNGNLETATFVVHDTDTEGRVGYSSGAGRDQNDYYYAILPDDGSVELSVTLENTSNDGGADAYLYIYDDLGRQLATGLNANVPAGTQQSNSITAFGRAQDTIFFRVYSLYSFAYTLHYKVSSPATGGDAEPNNALANPAPISYNESWEGRIGFRTGAGQDQDDYFQAVLPDDGAVRLIITYYNESNDSGADSYAYIYDHRGGQLTNATNANQEVGTTRTDTLLAYGRARDTVHFRIYSLYAFGYTARYDVISPTFPADEEPNDQLADAPVIGLGGGISGRVGFRGHTQDQNDYFRLSNPELASFSINIEGENASNDVGADLYFYLYNERGGLVRSFTLANMPPGRFSRTLSVECMDPSELFLRVYSLYAFSYDIGFAVTAEQPHAEIEYSRFGNRFAFVANSRRAESILWDFDDGTTSTLRYPTREFPIGVYDVTLSATNETCEETVVTTERLEIEGVEDYLPKHAGMAEPVGTFSIRFFGAGLSNDAEVTLTKGDLTLRPHTRHSPASTELTAFFDFDNAQIGTYDLRLILPSGQTVDFPGGFTIEQDAPGFDIQVEVIGPERIRTNRWVDYTLSISNDRARVATGVVVGLAVPREVETNLEEVIGRPTGDFLLKGEVWNNLSLNREDFDELYFGGEFDPDVDTFYVDYDAMDEALGNQYSIDIDTLYEEPYRGKLYLLNVPLVLAESTVEMHFQLRSTANTELSVVTFAWPEVRRDNPLNGKELDRINKWGLEAASIAGMTNIPAFKILGKVAGYVDIGSKIVFTEAADAWYGANNANADFYQENFTDLGVQVATEFLPFSDKADGYADAVQSGRRRMQQTTKNISKVESQLARTGKGRLKKSRAGQEARLEYLKNLLAEQGDNLTKNQKEEIIAKIMDYGTKKTIDLAKNEAKDALGISPEDACSTKPKKIKRKPVRSVRSMDPNAIYGNSGVGEAQFVTRDELLSYQISFENVDTAEVPAQIVRIEGQLDPTKFDLSRTFIGDVAFGGEYYKLEGERHEYFQDIDLRPTQDLIVRVNVKLDTLTGDYFWQFTSLNPDTGELPLDVDAGFLPPNKTSPEGEGAVHFTTALLPDIRSGDTVSAQALIFFDDNDPIATNVWSNVIDGDGPVSRLNDAYTFVGDSTIQITYNGMDQGSGLQDYYLHGRLAGEAWSHAVFPLTPEGVARVKLNNNQAYEFYVTAQDSAGNREVKVPRAELRVEVGSVSVPDLPEVEMRIALFPNPTAERSVRIASPEALADALLSVTDLNGRILSHQRINLSADTPLNLSLGDLPGGTYVVYLLSAEGRIWSEMLTLVE